MRLAINVLSGDLELASAMCRAEGIGAEITALAFPETLDSPDFDLRVADHGATLEGVEPLSSNGPFLDLYVTSRDPRILTVCRDRHEKALKASIDLSATIYVAHLGLVPLIRNRGYLADFASRAAEFWVPFAETAWKHGTTIVLENLWEPTPDFQRQVVQEAGHPGLQASFDNGHALMFSDVPAREWVDVLGECLAHCYLHDNDGQYDQHLPVGQGIEDWPILLDALDVIESDPLIVLESDQFDQNVTSLESIRRLLTGAASRQTRH